MASINLKILEPETGKVTDVSYGSGEKITLEQGKFLDLSDSEPAFKNFLRVENNLVIYFADDSFIVIPDFYILNGTEKFALIYDGEYFYPQDFKTTQEAKFEDPLGNKFKLSLLESDIITAPEFETEEEFLLEFDDLLNSQDFINILATASTLIINTPPTAVADSELGFITDENTAFTTSSVLANDFDPDPTDVLTVESINTTGTIGLVTDNGDGTFSYDPNGQFDFLAVGETATDTFSYTVTDGNGGTSTTTVTITINGVNDIPTANDDSGVLFTTDEDTTFTTASVLTNDTDPDASDVLSVLGIDTSLTIGIVTNNGDGTFEYDPNGQFESLAVGESTTDTFNYTVTDGNGGTASATVTIFITGVNDAPTANDDGGALFTTDEDTVFTTGNVLSNDTDPDASDVLSVLSLDTAGTVGLVTDNGDGTFAYDPNGQFESLAVGESTTDQFSYTVTDGNGGTATAMVTITINGVNDDPVANDDSGALFTTDEATAFVTGNVLTNDTDPDASDVLSVLSIDTTGTVGTVINNGDGTFGYDPAGLFEFLGLGESTTDTFSYTVTDGNGGTATATVTITINGLNDDPTANDDSGALFTTDEDTVFTTGNVLTNDTDPDLNDILSVLSFDTLGTIGNVTNNGDGTFEYDPDGQFESLAVGESTTDTFSYTVTDGNGGTATATVTITINGVNDSPTANDDSGVGFATDQDTVFTTGNVLTNDTDPDTSDVLSVLSLDTTGTVGIVTDNGDGTFEYDPDGQFDALAAGDSTTDTFSYTVTDGNGGTSTATVTITVTGLNDAPIAVDDTGVGFTTDEDSSFVTASVLLNDSDPDTGDSISLVSFDDAGVVGTLTSNGDGTFNYDPDGLFESLAAGETATETFTYTIEDLIGLQATATVTITINGVNDQLSVNSLPMLDMSPRDEDIVFRFEAADNDGDGSTADNPPDGTTITTWQDKSGNNLDASAPLALAPSFSSTAVDGDPGISFDGTERYSITSNPLINQIPLFTEKTIAVTFETGSDISGFQVIYEQGGGTRGYNISIVDGELYGYAYNVAEWAIGDRHKVINFGAIAANTKYSAVIVHDAVAINANFTLTGYLDGVLIETETSVAAMNAHGATNGLGGIVNSTKNPITLSTVGSGANFEGSISHAASWNRILTQEEIAANAVAIASEAVTLRNDLLNATDVDDSADEITYTVTSTTNGYIAFNSDTGTSITSFTQLDVDGDRVVFVQDTASVATASVDLSVADGGEDGTVPVALTVDFVVREPLTGTAGADALVGVDGADYLDGLGGVDTLVGGEGNDILIYDSLDSLVDGDAGYDILEFTTDSSTLDFDLIAAGTVTNVEQIALTGSSQTLNINPADIIDITDGDNTVIVTGDDTAAVTADFTGGTSSVTAEGFVQYVSADTLSTLLVDADIDQTGIIL